MTHQIVMLWLIGNALILAIKLKGFGGVRQQMRTGGGS